MFFFAYYRVHTKNDSVELKKQSVYQFFDMI